MSKTINGPSLETGMLAFARSVQITEGLFYATRTDNSNTRTPIEVREKGVRGQSSEDKAKNPGKSNPQSVDFAAVPQDHDGVELEFWIRFMPLSMKPHACDNEEVGEAYKRLATGYKKAGGFGVLSALYVWNIANARFAWRNRFQSDEMTVTVCFESLKLRFNPLKLRLDDGADRDEIAAALIEGDAHILDLLIERVADGLSNYGNDAFTVKVAWNAAMKPGQEIFPSQEYVREEKVDKSLSRVFAKQPMQYNDRTVYQASMHSQKIGAALRNIDIWHDSDDHAAPITVNPYGGVQETGAVLRDPKTRRSFYDLRKNAGKLLNDVEAAHGPNELSGEAHFVMANLIRGGVFGSSKKIREAN